MAGYKRHKQMKIYCTRCKILVGEILQGSKLRKGIKYLCTECEEAYKTLESLKNYEKGVGGVSGVSGDKSKGYDMPDFFEDLMKGKK